MNEIQPVPFAYALGYGDEQLGKGFLDNPFPQDSVEFRRWIDGYVQSIIDRRKPI